MHIWNVIDWVHFVYKMSYRLHHFRIYKYLLIHTAWPKVDSKK